MNDIKNLARNSVSEYGTTVVQDRYKNHAVSGLWESEKVLIDKYFQKGSSVLDLACGSGRATLPLHKLGYKSVGIDLTPEMITIAQDTAKKEQVSIPYYVGDATEMDFKDESFDGVLLSNNGLGSIPGHANRLKVLREISRTMKPNGCAILSIPLRDYWIPYLFYWIKTLIEYVILSHIGYTTEGVDFGDFFYHRNNNGYKMKQVQFMHFFSKPEVRNLVKASGLKIKEEVFMSKLSKKDVQSMRGSLSVKDRTEKIEIFYICQKV